ncbi:MAG: sodium:proton antiporter [Candidatus Azobacteroides sp.]|nr:sodium:proton antiporter [Candidatus Azobacteroides sp.]
MEAYSVVIILLAITIGLSPIASRMKFPYPVLLLIVGTGVGFIPGFRTIPIDPEVIFLLFLPPLLYSAAYDISIKDFKRNFSTISILAVRLVFVTTMGIAIAVHYCIGISWPLSFVLGAILSPPDAIATTSVTKGLGLPNRTNTVLEGESLINDASALVAFRFAVSAVAGSSFVLWKAGLIFILAIAGGLFIGWLVAHVFIFIADVKKNLDDYVCVSLNLLLPFVAYLIAEELYVSGVIATVTVGISIAWHRDRFSGATVAQSKSVMDMVVFILGGLVFILIGLEFPQVLKNIPSEQFLPLVGCSFLIFLIALLIRMFVVFWHKRRMDNRYTTAKKRLDHIDIHQKERIKQHFREKKKRTPFGKNIDDYFKSLLFNWKEAFIIGWSGMRGIVSLAAALSLPLIMTNGDAFPQRNVVIFLTVTVVIIMLVIQGLGLPVLVKLLKIDGVEA